MSLESLQQHSPKGPSAAERWIPCPGSVNATKDLADTTSDYAAEGTFAHYISELAREERQSASHYYEKKSEDGKFICDKEMVQAVQYFLNYVEQFECEEELIEAQVSYDAWVDGGFGTLDSGLLNDGTAIIIDLKYGKGIQIFAEDNPQLKLYALGLFQEHGHLYDFQTFKLCICQPRLDWIDEWEISVEDLLTWANEVVEPAADLADTEDAPFKAGSWCQWCKIKGTCKTRYEMVTEALVDELQEISSPNEMGEDELGEAMSLVPLIQKWCTDVTESVTTLVAKGKEIIGDDGLPFKMVEGRSNRAWRDAAEAEKAMRSHKIKVADMFTKKLITAPAFEKQFGEDHVIMKKHCIKPRGKPVLVPGSDKREAYAASVEELPELPDEAE
jgi:hypothetical protein